ncbi:hypothetical protein FDO65_01910 [Nakamurella flava]|uniref:Gluconate 2-dehydrogenase subunit 3 family protein n=1 Tax=Nakamurella flava TaxID=2576308 RepID=A0A4U6QJ61_9ACTN|nr:hypothetical protein [Nakamurella flava]TKV60487.1 hypothetical protein FDO65_01910 [Nakamurella flava]
MTDTVAQRLTTNQRSTLVRLLRVAYPHQNFPDGPYERTADAVLERVGASIGEKVGLLTGLESLDATGQGAFTDLSDEAALQVLRDAEDAPFFKVIRAVAVVALYNDHEVWELLGYEGASYDKGGYINRGFNDLDWLPEPRIEEYDGPISFVEVAESDIPAAASGATR